MSTLSDVARRAGVSAATVSNVLRDRGKVSRATRQRVLSIIKELGYRPHLTARALAEGRAPTIALMVSSIANPFYPEFALSAERAAQREGRYLIICNTNEDAAVGVTYLNQLSGSLAEGVLLMNSKLDANVLHDANKQHAPIVLCMWERPSEPPALPCVAVDFFEAGILAAQHLLSLGHRRIGAIVGSERNGIHEARYAGFLSAIIAAGLSMNTEAIRYTTDSTSGGYGACRDLLEKIPSLTAIFATNDLPALGAVHAAADLGWSVPDALSVIGITDIQLARESRPALTTIAVPTEEAACLAVGLLRELVEQGPYASLQEKLSDDKAENAKTTSLDPAASGGRPQVRVTSAPVLVRRDTTAQCRR